MYADMYTHADNIVGAVGFLELHEIPEPTKGPLYYTSRDPHLHIKPGFVKLPSFIHV